jgi:hypothetical protein
VNRLGNHPEGESNAFKESMLPICYISNSAPEPIALRMNPGTALMPMFLVP